MIHIEKNPVLHANEYYNTIGYGPAAKTKIQQELDQILTEIDHTTTIIGHQYEDYPFFTFVAEMVNELNKKHCNSHPLQIGFIDASQPRGLRIYSKNFQRTIGHRPISGRLDLDLSTLNSKVNP